MPISSEVNNSRDLVHSVATGRVNEADLLDYQVALLADPRVKPGFDELFDATRAHESGLSEAVLEGMVEADLEHTEKLRGGKCAIVVRSGFAWAERFVQSHQGPHDVMVFFNLEVAQAWIGTRSQACWTDRQSPLAPTQGQSTKGPLGRDRP
ncbi:MAG: hypothetical protein ACYTAS_05790 [Planctomycetota bacterium]|jgi:hypothetical protein